MIIGKISTSEGKEITIWRAFHTVSGYDCTKCQLKCCYGPYNLPLVDNDRLIELHAKFPLFASSCINDPGLRSKHLKQFYHREVGCLFLKKDGSCSIHDETLASDPQKPLRPLVCQVFPLILRKAASKRHGPIRFAYVYPCGSGTGFQWISKHPITNQSIIEIMTKAESFYELCFCDQVDHQDSHQDVNFNVLEQYGWTQNYMTTMEVPIIEELLLHSKLSSSTMRTLMADVLGFLRKWNNYMESSQTRSLKEITLDVLTKSELGSFNAFAIWILYNSRLMEIPQLQERWKVGFTALLFPIHHLLLQEMEHIPVEEKDWITMVNEACWDTVHLVMTTLPTLAKENKLNAWKELQRMFILLNP